MSGELRPAALCDQRQTPFRANEGGSPATPSELKTFARAACRCSRTSTGCRRTGFRSCRAWLIESPSDPGLEIDWHSATSVASSAESFPDVLRWIQPSPSRDSNSDAVYVSFSFRYTTNPRLEFCTFVDLANPCIGGLLRSL